ncbi:uncharacterized protein CTRU02_200338 [Colletotrichum truncatum]|uniref:Uncharacterized protein n=1 Tax=Colletotrichum truncatum TaxID=5467 RepID=A0ACC3ZEC2_COLTU|nr:uncharacterized protein CTRU02_00094 [Colletotrichum truncatum]KAF6801345.1 hypothetical protein CTRU02_00094 [Colletotrichum truncatum]
MHFFTKFLRAGVILHIAFQCASSAVLRGRSGDVESNQLPAGEYQLFSRDSALTDVLETLDKHLNEFLNTWSSGHRNQDNVDVAKLAKRQNVQIPRQALEELLRLIQSIETQLVSIISSGSISSSGGAVQPPTDTAGNAEPTASPGLTPSSPAQSANPPATSSRVSEPQASGLPSSNSPNPPATNDPNVGPPTPTPFLTSSGAGPRDSITTAYGTAASTGTLCKKTLTQTFTSYVYEDGTPAVAPKARSIEDDDEDEDPELDDPEQSVEQVVEVVESWVDPDVPAPDDDWNLGQSVAESWASSKTRRDLRKSPGRSNLLLIREEENALELLDS